MPSHLQRIAVLGTGGTIAGASSHAHDHVGYVSAQRPVGQLLAGLPGLGPEAADHEQVAQVDSKDMGPAVWVHLLERLRHHLARPEVRGVVVTHGTDTIEETAYWLHRVLAPAKPVVLTAAMRPATALGADGPQNLMDAALVARAVGARGVLVAMAGQVHAARTVRKWHPYRVDALSSGDAGPVALVEGGRLRALCDWPEAGTAWAGPPGWAADPAGWPWVEVVASHAGTSGQGVRALLAAGVRGLVVAGTGNGTVHEALQAALQAAVSAGVPVWRCTRCASGALVGDGVGPAGALSPWQARIELQLALLSGDPPLAAPRP